MMKKIATLLCLCFSFLLAKADMVCLDINNPVLPNGTIAPSAQWQNVQATGAKCVRLNFILYSGNGGTSVNNIAWQNTYDSLISQLKNQAGVVDIYGLVTRDVMSYETPLIQSNGVSRLEIFDPTSGGHQNGSLNWAHGDNLWIASFRQKVITIINRFKADVKHFEITNEPDDWYRPPHQGGRIAPRYLARIMKEVYYFTHQHQGGLAGHEDIKIISGPLLRTDSGDWSTLHYLRDFLEAGLDHERWYNQLQLDGYGYHIYVSQNGAPHYTTLRNKVRDAIDEFVVSVNMFFPGSLNTKKIYISEIGWENDKVGSVRNQAIAMYWGMSAALFESEVEMVSLFCHQDFYSYRFKRFGLRYSNMVFKRHTDGRDYPRAYFAYMSSWHRGEGGVSMPEGLAEVIAEMEKADREEREAGLASSIHVFPNPATDHLRVLLTGDFGNRAELQLQTLSGQVLLRQSLDPSVQRVAHLNLADLNLPQGIFIVSLASETQKVTEKIVIH